MRLLGEVVCLDQVVAVGEGHGGAAGVPDGIAVVAGVDRQVVGVAIQAGRALRVAAEDRHVAECLQRPAHGDRVPAVRGGQGGLRG